METNHRLHHRIRKKQKKQQEDGLLGEVTTMTSLATQKHPWAATSSSSFSSFLGF